MCEQKVKTSSCICPFKRAKGNNLRHSINSELGLARMALIGLYSLSRESPEMNTVFPIHLNLVTASSGQQQRRRRQQFHPSLSINLNTFTRSAAAATSFGCVIKRAARNGLLHLALGASNGGGDDDDDHVGTVWKSLRRARLCVAA